MRGNTGSLYASEWLICRAIFSQLESMSNRAITIHHLRAKYSRYLYTVVTPYLRLSLVIGIVVSSSWKQTYWFYYRYWSNDYACKEAVVLFRNDLQSLSHLFKGAWIEIIYKYYTNIFLYSCYILIKHESEGRMSSRNWHVYDIFYLFYLVLLRSSTSLSRIIFVFLLFPRIFIRFFSSNVTHYY